MTISQQSQTLSQIKYRKYEMDFSSCFSVARKTTYFICFFLIWRNYAFINENRKETLALTKTLAQINFQILVI